VSVVGSNYDGNDWSVDLRRRMTAIYWTEVAKSERAAGRAKEAAIADGYSRDVHALLPAMDGAR
jgi:hypothetical protein